MAGKGDRPRHLRNKRKFDQEYDMIFGKARECCLNHQHTWECVGYEAKIKAKLEKDKYLDD